MATDFNEGLLTLLEIFGLSSSNPKLSAITAKANKELLKINEEFQELLDAEAKKEAEEKAAAEAKAKKEADAKAKKEADELEAAAKAQSARRA